jgi:tetratricopeptide (TPR) repeat protein
VASGGSFELFYSPFLSTFPKKAAVQITSSRLTKEKNKISSGMCRITAALLLLTLATACASAQIAETGPNPGLEPLTPGQTLSGNYIAGRHAQAVRDDVGAALFLDAALEQAPKNPRLLNRAFVFNLAEGNITRAVKLAKRLREINNKSSIAIYTLAVDGLKHKQYEKTNSLLSGLRETNLDNYIGPLLKAWAFTGLKDREKAIAALKPLTEKIGDGAIYNLQLALVNEALGANEEAETAFRSATSNLRQVSFRMVELFGSFLDRNGKKEEAKIFYQEFIKARPGNDLVEKLLAGLEKGIKPAANVPNPAAGAAESLFNLAGLLQNQKVIETALIFSRLSLHLRPDFPVLQIQIANILERLRRFDKANEVYTQINSKSQFSWSVQMQLASNLDRLDRTEDAVLKLQKMTAQNPSDPAPSIALGDILRSRERHTEAIAAYDTALAQIESPEARHWSLFYARGISLEQSKEWPRAESDFLKALDLNADHPLVLNYLGYSWVDRGQNLERAQQMIVKAVALRPNDGYIADSLGWVYYKVGKYKDAVKELDRAVELLPADPIINDHLGDAFWRVGRVREAQFQWNHVLGLNPKPELEARVKTKLKVGLKDAAQAKAGNGG